MKGPEWLELGLDPMCKEITSIQKHLSGFLTPRPPVRTVSGQSGFAGKGAGARRTQGVFEAAVSLGLAPRESGLDRVHETLAFFILSLGSPFFACRTKNPPQRIVQPLYL